MIHFFKAPGKTIVAVESARTALIDEIKTLEWLFSDGKHLAENGDARTNDKRHICWSETRNDYALEH